MRSSLCDTARMLATGMKRFLFTAHAVFALVGIATTMLGPLLPVLAQRWHLTDRQSGMLFLVQFVGGFAGAIVSTRLARHFSLHIITRAGLLLTASGFLALATPWRGVATLGIAIYGIGIGLSTPSITAAVSEAVPDCRASMLNLLNFAWALGAIAAPNLILAALHHGFYQIPGMLILYAIVLIGSAFLIPRTTASAFPEEPPGSKLPPSTLRLIIACGILIFVYVGIENGVAGWLPTFATRVHAFDLQRGALLQDTFWATFLLGRFSAPTLLRIAGDRFLLTLSICVAAAGTIALLSLHGNACLFLSVAVVGLGCAAIFPTAIAILSHRLSGQSGSTLGFMFASAGLGAAVLPFAIGSLSSATQNLRLGMSLLLLAEVVLLIAHIVMSHIAAQTNPADTETADAVLAGD